MICSVAECDKPVKCKQLCRMHYNRVLRYGRTNNVKADKGRGRPMTPEGYILIAVNGKRMYEHRHVMEKKLGRSLRPGEIVHHINEIRSDNRPENLAVMESQSDHASFHNYIKGS